MVKNTSGIGYIEEGGQTGRTTLEEYGTNLIGISGCLVLIVDSGYAIVSVGLKRRVLKKGMIIVLFYDDTFHMEISNHNFVCRYVSLAYTNVEEVIFKVTSPNFWNLLSDINVFFLDALQQERIDEWYRQMEWICNEKPRGYTDGMLRNNIHNLFMAMDYELEYRKMYVYGNLGSGRSLILKFLKLLPQMAQHTRSVTMYAEQLCITTTYLNKLSHQWLRTSPKKLITQQVICEIKTLLATTDFSIKQIATILHFDDSSYMCRYFRCHTGRSPMEYRNGTENT